MLVVAFTPSSDTGGSAVTSYRIVGVPVSGGSNVTVTGAGTAVAGGNQVRARHGNLCMQLPVQAPTEAEWRRGM